MIVSARGQTRSRTALLLPSVTHRSPATAAIVRSRSTRRGTVLRSGPKYNASSSTCGTPRAAASSRANVVLPDPVLPRTKIRSHPRSVLAGSRTGPSSAGVIDCPAWSSWGMSPLLDDRSATTQVRQHARNLLQADTSRARAGVNPLGRSTRPTRRPEAVYAPLHGVRRSRLRRARSPGPRLHLRHRVVALRGAEHTACLRHPPRGGGGDEAVGLQPG